MELVTERNVDVAFGQHEVRDAHVSGFPLTVANEGHKLSLLGLSIEDLMSADNGRLSPHTKILLALCVGAVGGIGINQWLGRIEDAGLEEMVRPFLNGLIHYVLQPIGQVFLRMLFMTVIPLVFASLALGVAQLGGQGSLGRIGLKTISFFVLTMTCAVVIGLLLVNVYQPGARLSEETRAGLHKEMGVKGTEAPAAATTFGIDTFINIVPRNPLKALVEMDMLAVICFALFVGIALTQISKELADPLIKFLAGVNQLMVVLIGWAMKLAPLGVFSLIFTVTARFGFEVLQSLGGYVAIVLLGIGIQLLLVLPLILIVAAKCNPLTFFRKARPILVTAFSTSSSNATLPTSIKTAEEQLGVHPSIAGFVLPLGATMNMNGTALFEGVTVVFLAQVFGVELTLRDQLIVVTMAVVTAIGAAGVPGGSLPLLGMVLNMVRVPSGGVALIMGVDRLLDMCRTTLNVAGDVVAAVVIARSEGLLSEDRMR